MNYRKIKTALLNGCQLTGLCLGLLVTAAVLADESPDGGGEISSINTIDRTIVVSGKPMHTTAMTRFYDPDGKTIARSKIEAGMSISYRQEASVDGPVLTEVWIEVN